MLIFVEGAEPLVTIAPVFNNIYTHKIYLTDMGYYEYLKAITVFAKRIV